MPTADLCRFVFDRNAYPASLWALLGARIIRSSQWLSQLAANSWVVDVRRLRFGDADCFELGAMQSLRKIIESMAPVWDETQGVGIVGIQGGAAWRKKSGWGGRADPRGTYGEGGFHYCAGLLDQLAVARKWSRAPLVMSDL